MKMLLLAGKTLLVVATGNGCFLELCGPVNQVEVAFPRKVGMGQWRIIKKDFRCYKGNGILGLGFVFSSVEFTCLSSIGFCFSGIKIQMWASTENQEDYKNADILQLFIFTCLEMLLVGQSGVESTQMRLRLLCISLALLTWSSSSSQGTHQ